MAEADDRGSMLALVGAPRRRRPRSPREAGVTVANDNAPGQVVLSGDRDALARAEELARERGRRALPLDVAGAFHSPAMEPAVEPFRARAGRRSSCTSPRFPVVSCSTAEPFDDVRAELAAALTRPVRWRETVLALRDAGVAGFVEVGPGKVLARLGKRIAPDMPVEEPVHA